jgi:DNA-directed RNA polymerase specialized sigma24 family protein
MKKQPLVARRELFCNAGKRDVRSGLPVSYGAKRMSGAGSVTTWISELKNGNQEAARLLWERYFEELVRIARTKLRKTSGMAANEEDVALLALNSVFRGARQGRFPQLQDRNNLWPLLVVITVRKSIDLVQHERAQKRRPRQGPSQALPAELLQWIPRGEALEHALGREPTPEFAAEVLEEYERLLGQLTEPALREIAIMKMEGYTDKEVAAKRNCGLRTVERKLERIRHIWKKEIAR